MIYQWKCPACGAGDKVEIAKRNKLIELLLKIRASRMGRGWNISLFHYRNHGAAYGRVLVGIQVPAVDKKRFRRFLDELGYVYFEEVDNPAYDLFLGTR